MSHSARSAKKDLNQPEIEQALRKIGAAVLSIAEVKNAFDMVVGFRGEVFLMEIKNPEYKPKRKSPASMLSAGEADCHAKFARVGVPVHIVFSIDEALKLIMIGAV